MAITQCIWDSQTSRLNNIAASGGTATFDYAIPTDTICYLRAEVLFCYATAGHLALGAHMRTEYVVENRNGALVAGTAYSNSTNPDTSTNTAATIGVTAATDEFSAIPTATYSISGANGRLTVTNNDASKIVDAIVFLTVMIAKNV
jgi:hypothetical protein